MARPAPTPALRYLVLRIAPAAQLIELERLRGMDDTPVCVDNVVLVHSPATALLDVDLTNASLFESLERHCGLSVHRSAYSVQAVAADGRLADLLRIDPGAPVLVGREVAYTADVVPILMLPDVEGGPSHAVGHGPRFMGHC